MSSISFDSYDDIYLMSSGDLDVTSNCSSSHPTGQGRVQKSFPVVTSASLHVRISVTQK
jgi:hypothetical protein